MGRKVFVQKCPECGSKDITVHSQGNIEYGGHYHCNVVEYDKDGKVTYRCGTMWRP